VQVAAATHSHRWANVEGIARAEARRREIKQEAKEVKEIKETEERKEAKGDEAEKEKSKTCHVAVTSPLSLQKFTAADTEEDRRQRKNQEQRARVHRPRIQNPDGPATENAEKTTENT
jgi:hypothetical protein